MALGDTWKGTAPVKCDICERELVRMFIDGKTSLGPWGIMCPPCRVDVGPKVLGEGRGQKYERVAPSMPWVRTG